MPRSGGQYFLPPVYVAQPGTTIRAEQHNLPLQDIAQALTGSVARDGSSSMLGNLHMNGRRVTGMADGVADTDAATVGQIPASSEWLGAVATLTMAADRLPYATGPTTAALAAFTELARTLLAAPLAQDMRNVLQLTIVDAARAILNAAVAHNDAAWAAGAATTPGFPSPAQVARAGVGGGQTWQAVTRAVATSYQNTTGKPIQLAVIFQGQNARLQVSSDNATWINVAWGAENGSDAVTANPIIPAGWFYRLAGTSPDLRQWTELR